MPLEHMGDFELGRAALDGPGTTTGEDRRLLASPVPERIRHPVPHVKVLGLDPVVVKRDHAIGQDAVDVGDQKLDRLAPRGQISLRPEDP